MGNIVVVLSIQIVGDAQYHVIVSELKLFFNGWRISELTSQTRVEQQLDPLFRIALECKIKIDVK